MFEARDYIRFWSRVKIAAGGCAEWQGASYPSGYGEFHFDGRTHPAHRIAFLMSNGTLEPGLSVLHSCDNRKCVEPAHLSAGTHQENMQDMVRKGRHADQSGLRTKLTPAQATAIRNDPRSQRRIAADYGIGKSTVGVIKKGTLWSRPFVQETTREVNS